MFVLFLLTIFFVVLESGHGELFTAMTHMEPLARIESDISSNIDQYVALEMKKIQDLRQLASHYKEHHQRRKSDNLAKSAQNPMSRYAALKHITDAYNVAIKIIRTDDSVNTFLGNFTGLPGEDDLSGASTAIFRIQDVYRLTAADLADGRVPGLPKLGGMTAHDCFELGRQAYWDEDYYHTIHWMEEALGRQRREKVKTVEEVEILDYLSFALYQQGNLQQAWAYAKRIAAIKPDDQRAKENVRHYAKEMDEAGIKKSSVMPPVTNMRPSDPALPEREMYEALCRGEDFKTAAEKSKLYCYYKRDRPFLKLAPIKVQIVNFEPLAVLFKQVLSEREIDLIKQITWPRLKRATVHNKATGQLETANYRITKNAWLKSEHHPYIARINKRLDDMTNLDQNKAEDFQVANYGLGGHYDPHFDHSTRDESDPFEAGQGNRIATVLFYMEQTLAGGATVFIPVKAVQFPSKGDALFWYNIHSGGEGDDRTRHAACPVLAGQKWVANKWIHERGQEFRRPCLKTEEQDELRVRELNTKNFSVL